MVCVTMALVPHSWKTVLMEHHNSMQEQQEHRKKKLRELSNSKKELRRCLLFHDLELHN
jgi:hypothetical protein